MKLILILGLFGLSACSVASIREPAPGERITVIVQKESIGGSTEPLAEDRRAVRGS